MNRRDFLSLRVSREVPTLELSCHHLYMRCLDALESSGGAAASEASVHEPWMGEPPSVFALPTADDLLRQVEEDLRQVQRLRVLDSEWLESTELGARIAPVLASFRARGGQVEFLKSLASRGSRL
jgi:hypothetical protein